MALKVADGLRQLSESGTRVFFLHGNRDFMVGSEYCARAGMQLCQEPVAPDIQNPPTAMIHGDTLCTDDHAYQRFRRKVRDPAWQAKMRSRPLWWRRLLARVARTISKRGNRGKPADIMDVNADAVAQCFRDLGTRRLIHGHTHRPGVHQIDIDGQPCERIVLGDWHGEVGSVCEITPQNARLLRLHRNPAGHIELTPTQET